MGPFEPLMDEVTRLWPFAALFSALALITKGASIRSDLRKASPEIRTNIAIFVVDCLLIIPFVVLPVSGIITGLGWELFAFWERLPALAVLLLAISIGDYVGYWRHRLNHLPILWPFHATHHSDRSMNWFSLSRVHPLERLYTATLDSTVLALLGFPIWAIVLNNFIRNAWGYFIHADLRWTLGAVGHVMISPSAHRWHHVRDLQESGTNFATIFTAWDRLHGTYRHSKNACEKPTGVEDHGGDYIYEMLSPPRLWGEMIHQKIARVFRRPSSK